MLQARPSPLSSAAPGDAAGDLALDTTHAAGGCDHRAARAASADRAACLASLRQALGQRILCLDGAMGTAVQSLPLCAADFGGPAFEGCPEILNLRRPDLIEDIHRRHLEAGADIIESNTFGSSVLVLAEYPPLDQQAYEVTLAGARLARRLADAHSTPERPRFVAGAMGPTTKAISVTGGVGFDDLSAAYREQARALVAGGVDYLLLETCQDTRNIKAALLGIGDLSRQLALDLPVAVSVTIEPMGTMLAGQGVEALWVSLAHFPLLYVGLNCGTGPDFMADHLRALSEMATVPVACVPNAGLPDEDGRYLETPAMIAATLGRFVAEGWVNLVGGCCGTTALHTAALAALCQGRPPRRVPTQRRARVSGIEMVEIDDDKRPLLVGERTNSLGSKIFRELIARGAVDEAAEIARRQVGGGAQVLDICLQNPDRDEAADMERFLAAVTRTVKLPLMIDSTDAQVVEVALRLCPGKSIINSINLEDGLARFERVVPLARRYGASLVVGCIDDDRQAGMAVTRARKLAVAERSYRILTRDFAVDPTDIIFDPLVFPCASGDASYRGSAAETLEGLRLIKQALPDCKTVLGISNVSFGLPAAGREVLNSIFLYHAVQAGLDLAIVNSEKLERYPEIPDCERQLAEAVLFDGSEQAIAAFVAHFRGQKQRPRKDVSRLPLDVRLAGYVVSGSRDGLLADLERKLDQGAAPLAIINGPLLAGMDEVGRLFRANQLIVAEVLQSAEVMKAAVAYLEPRMEKGTRGSGDDGASNGSGATDASARPASSANRGTLLLATVKGDVHDIGKNLVEIIFANNGYRVVNLGTKVPPHELQAAIAAHRPDLVGLSGLLVKSAQQMVVTAAELSQHGPCPPLLVGGAALTRGFTRRRIAPAYRGTVAYARDAMSGLELAGRLLDPTARPGLDAELAEEARQLAAQAARESATAGVAAGRVSGVAILDQVPAPPDHQRHVVRQLVLDEIWPYLNPKMLYGRHLGLRGDPEEMFARGDEKAIALRAVVEEVKALSRPTAGGAGAIVAAAVWRFLPAASRGDTVLLYAPVPAGGRPEQVLAELSFPRQGHGERLCLADLVRPEGHPGPCDSVALFATTAGAGIGELAATLLRRGEYLRSHGVQALALETAEAAAEWLHCKLRAQWGFPDPPSLSMLERFQAGYRGKRYSPGYPSCPDLGLQTTIFALLHPTEIGVSLTDELMMEPEASVSALVFHHPAARYFSTGKEYLE